MSKSNEMFWMRFPSSKYVLWPAIAAILQDGGFYCKSDDALLDSNQSRKDSDEIAVEFVEKLTKFEEKLLKRLQVVKIRGKTERGVPVILSFESKLASEAVIDVSESAVNSEPSIDASKSAVNSTPETEGVEIPELLDMEESSEEEHFRDSKPQKTERKRWSKKEEDELKILFTRNFEKDSCPRKLEIEKAMKKSWKKGGLIHRRPRDNIKKKVSGMLVKLRKK